MEAFWDKIKFDTNGLIPAVVQDALTNSVLMVAYMNKEALQLTIETGKATYFSRSRQKLWVKGETSGNTQKVVDINFDCDGDCLLVKVEQTGVACHTGEYSCFHNRIYSGGETTVGAAMLYDLYAVILDRKNNPKEGSYTNYLFSKGLDKIIKKVGEEACEVIIAAKNGDLEELRYEIADLVYHLLVAMVNEGLSLEEIFSELKQRR